MNLGQVHHKGDKWTANKCAAAHLAIFGWDVFKILGVAALLFQKDTCLSNRSSENRFPRTCLKNRILVQDRGGVEFPRRAGLPV
jgi:hypothetical protein